MYRQIHQAQLGVVLDLFLPVKGHGVISLHPGVLHEVTGLHEHTAAAAGRVQQNALSRFEHIDDHLDQRLGGKNTPSSCAMFLANLLRKYS